MIYKIIFSITIFVLNFMIIKDEIPNYSKEEKIMLLLLSLLWFPVFLMELRTTIHIMMTTMIICIVSSKISCSDNSDSTDAKKFCLLIISFLLVLIPCMKISEIVSLKEVKIGNWFFLKLLISFLVYGFSINLTDIITVPIFEKEETAENQIAMSEDDDNL